MRLGVNFRSSLQLIAILLQWATLAFLFPLMAALIFAEPIWPWLVSAALMLAVGVALRQWAGESAEINLREAFLVVGLSWLLIALLGSVPYILLNSLPPIDAFFETMSGFTTTGASMLTDIEGQPRSLLLWRAFTQWLGGMGIIVLAIAVLPRLAIGGRQLMEAEVPGVEMEKLTPRIRETAQTLWVLYVGLTFAEIAAFSAAGMSLYDSLIHALTTLPSGGFSSKASGAAAFSPVAQWLICFFMLVAGANFALLYRSFKREPKLLTSDPEFRAYIFLVGLGALFIFVNILGQYGTLEEGLRHSLFQSVSIITTTGHASTNFNEWSSAAHVVLLFLMFLGGSAGSTAGSIKILRWLLFGKLLWREIKQILHPRAVIPVKYGNRVVSEAALRGVLVFVLVFVAIFVAGTIFLLFDVARAGGINGRPITAIEAMTAVAASLGNIGPGVGAFGPMDSFVGLPIPSKILLALLMWVGRLEVFPALVLFTIGFWRR